MIVLDGLTRPDHANLPQGLEMLAAAAAEVAA
jgi:hypothetical protein